MTRLLESAPACRASASDALHAGLDFKKAGEDEMAAMILAPFEVYIYELLKKGDPDMEMVRRIIREGNLLC